MKLVVFIRDTIVDVMDSTEPEFTMTAGSVPQGHEIYGHVLIDGDWTEIQVGPTLWIRTETDAIRIEKEDS